MIIIMEILPPKYINIDIPYSSGMKIMLKQKEVHNERMKFFHKVSQIHGNLIRLNSKINLLYIGEQSGIQQFTFNIQV